MQNYIKPFKAGSFEAPNNVFLAPLAGVTDKAFRMLCASYGAGMMFTEMISAKGVHYGGNGSIELGDTEGEKGPVSVQIFGSEPDLMLEAALKFKDGGAKAIDINMGCPMKKITANREGSYLMNDPPLIEKIVSSVVKCGLPVSVKMRRGYDSPSETAVECALAAQSGGASWVTVHGRFRDQYYSGKADYGVISRVKSALSIPVVGNGDITDTDSARRMFEETGCDAVMVGRAALGKPWIFSEITEGRPEPGAEEKLDTILRHIKLISQYKGEFTGAAELRKHVSWYISGLPGSARIRDRIMHTESTDEISEIVREYFTGSEK